MALFIPSIYLLSFFNPGSSHPWFVVGPGHHSHGRYDVLTIMFWCNHGKHRSVAAAEITRMILKRRFNVFDKVSVVHLTQIQNNTIHYRTCAHCAQGDGVTLSRDVKRRMLNVWDNVSAMMWSSMEAAAPPLQLDVDSTTAMAYSVPLYMWLCIESWFWKGMWAPASPVLSVESSDMIPDHAWSVHSYLMRVR